MHARCGRAFVHERAMFIRPPENRAIEILHVRETGRAQASSQFGGAITDCAIGNNWNISCRAGQSAHRAADADESPFEKSRWPLNVPAHFRTKTNLCHSIAV